MRRGKASAAAVVVAALLLAACSDDDESSALPGATVATEPSADAVTTTTLDPYAIPQVIDEAYVNRVLAGLDAVVGDVVRRVVDARAVSPEALDHLRAVYDDPALLELQVDLLRRDVASGLSTYRVPPGNKRTVVSDLITATASCIFAEVKRDYSEVTITPNPPLDTQWVVLVRSGESHPSPLNPTPWVFSFEGFTEEMTAPEDPCAGS